MTSLPRRRLVLAGLLAAVVIVAGVLLRDVLSTVFFGVTVAYVALPLRQRLVGRGLDRRVASAVVTAGVFTAALLLVFPLAVALYFRRHELLDRLAVLPDTVPIRIGELGYTVDVAAALAVLRGFLTDVAVAVARSAPVLALKAMLFAFVVYALLVKPAAPRAALRGLVPSGYHDVVTRLDDRTRRTLNAIYVLQAATAAVTFVTALALFAMLGYRLAFAYAVVAAVLQFVPVLGPSLLIVGVAAFDVTFGATTRALLVLLVGLPAVGFLPDAVVRPRLAERTANLPGSVYFVGFVGGVLSVGPVGFIAGPLVVALLVEMVLILSD